MAFTAKVIVYDCDNCPHKLLKKVCSLSSYICPKISNKPQIAYNGILGDCPFNKPEKDICGISTYVKSRNENN